MKAYPFSVILMGIFLIVHCTSCREREQAGNKITGKKTEEHLVKANKNLVKTEDMLIDDFLERYRWNMNKTGTGLRYMVYKTGTGNTARRGNIVTFSYTLKLLNGDLCYTSNEKGVKVFKVGQGGVEPGLEEVILFLKKGDRAKIIIPSHLAFGLVGDGDKIPSKATLVYDLEVLEIK